MSKSNFVLFYWVEVFINMQIWTSFIVWPLGFLSLEGYGNFVNEQFIYELEIS